MILVCEIRVRACGDALNRVGAEARLEDQTRDFLSGHLKRFDRHYVGRRGCGQKSGIFLLNYKEK
jgi:hypothetical protein